MPTVTIANNTDRREAARRREGAARSLREALPVLDGAIAEKQAAYLAAREALDATVREVHEAEAARREAVRQHDVVRDTDERFLRTSADPAIAAFVAEVREMTAKRMDGGWRTDYGDRQAIEEVGNAEARARSAAEALALDPEADVSAAIATIRETLLSETATAYREGSARARAAQVAAEAAARNRFR